MYLRFIMIIFFAGFFCASGNDAPAVKVSTYAGLTSSQHPGMAPTVATIIDDGTNLKCHVIFFEDETPVPLAAVVKKNKGKGKNKDGVKFEGVSKDPRGINFSWSVTFKDDMLVGSYKQPYDSGNFVLTNQYPQKKPKANKAASVATANWIAVALERLVPFGSFYVSVKPNDHLKPDKKEGSNLRVSLSVSRSPETPEGSTEIDVSCYDLHHSQRRFPEDDLSVFMRAGEAAKAGEKFKEEVKTRTFRGAVKSIYEVVQKEGGSKIVVTRGDEKVEFEASEADRVREALTEAKVGEAWFTKLLGTTPLPQTTEEARPPRAGEYYLSSLLGIVDGRGIDYEVSVGTNSFAGEPRYCVEHCISFQTKHGEGSCGGEWVEGLLRKVTEALQAVEKGTKYSFMCDNAEHRYSVSANLETKEADVTFYPGKMFGKEDSKHGHFGQAQLAEIRRHLDEYEARKTWFQEHEGWFITSADDNTE